MYPAGSILGDGLSTRRFSIGTTLVAGQVVCLDPNASRVGEISDPSSATSYEDMVGIAMEAGTVSTTQGTGASSADVYVRSTWNPFQLIKGKCSGGATDDTAFAETTDGNLLTNTSASSGGIVITDADVGTSDFIGGWAFALSGNNKGQRRIIASHSDATSETVTTPFDYAIAVGDTFVRTYAMGNQGCVLTTALTQFNMKPAAGENIPHTGSALIWEVEIDITNQGTPTAPVVHALWVAHDHFLNRLA